MRFDPSRRAGFTILEILIVVAIIGLLAVIAVPRAMKARETAARSGCINNLRQIDWSKEQWAIEQKQSAGNPSVQAEVDAYMKKPPTCPAGGAYTYGNVGDWPTCGIIGHALP